MLRYFATFRDKAKRKIDNVLTARISADANVPADELVITVPYSKDYERCEKIEAYDGEMLVFCGQADEVAVIVSSGGAIVKITARSLAAGLLDNEAEPVTYKNPSAEFIFERHLKPFGIKTFDGDTQPFYGELKIEKGMSHWQVLEKFCKLRYGKTPVITGAGTALMRGKRILPRTITFGRGGIECLSARKKIRPYTLLSEVRLKLEKYGGYKSVLKNNNVSNTVTRVRYVNAFDDNGAVKTADRMIENGNKNCLEITLKCPVCLCDVIMGKAEIKDDIFGTGENMIIKSTEYVLDKNGENTTVVLGKENGDVADELHN